MFGLFGKDKGGGMDDDKRKKFTEDINKLRENMAKDMVSEEMLEDFISLVKKQFNREGIQVNKETITAFRTAFEMVEAEVMGDVDNHLPMIVSCDRYLAEERDKDDLASRIKIADDEE